MSLPMPPPDWDMDGEDRKILTVPDDGVEAARKSVKKTPRSVDAGETEA